MKSPKKISKQPPKLPPLSTDEELSQAAQMIKLVGLAVYGDFWQDALAKELRRSQKTIYRWMTDQTPLTKENRVMLEQKFKDLLNKKAQQVSAVQLRLERYGVPA